jgi:hypothetical protein
MPCKSAVLSIGALLGKLEGGGGSFTGSFERNRECISGFLYLGPRGHLKLSPGVIWNFSNEQGSPKLI